MGQLHAIRRIRRCLSTDATRTVLHAFVTWCIDYGNALLVEVPKKHLARLQQVQNLAIRVLYNLRKYDHISAYLAQEHWLPVVKRITYKICLILFKCIHGIWPKYLSDMLEKECDTRYGLRPLGSDRKMTQHAWWWSVQHTERLATMHFVQRLQDCGTPSLGTFERSRQF